MMKRILSVLLVLCMLCAMLPMGVPSVQAYSDTDIAYPVEGGNIYFDKATGTITGCDSSVTAAGIPAEIDGVAVTSIGDSAFSGCRRLTVVTIPDSVTSVSMGAFSGCRNLKTLTLPSVYGSCFGGIFGASSYEYNRINVPVSLKEVVLTSATSIGDYSFCGCNGLTSITIPEGVTMIGDNAFSGCTGLQSIMIPKSVTSVDCGAFYHCTGLTSITIPESVTNIGGSAFSDCTALTSITIPESVTSIGGSAFSDCTALTSITIPKSVTSIGWGAFYGCTSLKNITIPESVTSIGESAFDGCTDLTGIWVDAKNPYYSNDVSGVLFNKSKTEVICAPKKINGNYTIPESVTSIGQGAFYGCTSLKSISIPNGVTSIGGSAFSDCTALTSITIPESVTSIGWGAFYDCTGLTSITIPESVTSISYDAFYGCSELEGIWVDTNNPYYSSDASGVLFNKNKTELICAPGKINGKYTLPESVTSIGGSAFQNCTSLKSISIPNGVTSIGRGAFYGCTSLKNITIPESVTSIGDEAFSDCSSLTSVTIPESVTSIGENAFSDCTVLTSITIPKSVTSIGRGAFYGCTSLKNITIPESVTSISWGAFYGCTSLTSISIPKSVTSIDFWVFSGCTGLTDITIPESVTRIDWGAFYGCTGLTGITIPKSVTNISDYAFSCCSALKGIWVDANNPYYSNDASGVLFNKSKTELICAPGKISGNYTIPKSVTRIGYDAFYGCSELEGIWVDTNNPYYSSDASGVLFNKNKTELICAPGKINGKYTLPESVTSIGEGAFHGCTGLTSVTIPDGVTTIGEEIRYEGLVMWGGYQPCHRGDSCTGGVFSDCTGLTSITIPESVTSIDDYTFIGCKNLSAVCFTGNSPTIGLDVFTLFDNQTQPEFSIPGESICYIIPGLSIYYIAGREGWTSPTWNGYPTATWDGVNIPHIHSYQVVVTAPTCTEKGFTTHTCECGDSYIDTYIDAFGHDFGEWTQTKAPTCTGKGEEKRTCSRCEAYETREVAATGHAEVIDKAVPATCTEAGKTEGKHCSACGTVLAAQETIPAPGHDYKDGVCTVCGAKDPNYKPTEPGNPTEPSEPTEATDPTEPSEKPTVEFTDVAKKAWYYNAVEYAVTNGLMNGVGKDKFEPDTPMTRAMLVTVLWRHEGEPEAPANTFSDVKAGTWYFDAVSWAAANNIVGGVGNNKFDPDGNITREQMATILYRYCNGKDIDTSKQASISGFPDAEKVSSYAKTALQWTVAEGIISGSDGKLLPQGNATRAQVATILMRFIENIA